MIFLPVLIFSFFFLNMSIGFNKGRNSKFRVGSRVRQTPEELLVLDKNTACKQMSSKNRLKIK